MKKFLREYRVELIALAAALLGVFLLTEQFEIRATLRAWLSALANGLWLGLNALIDRLLVYLKAFTLSDLLGWLLVIGAIVFTFWRARLRFVSSTYWQSKVCPRCGSSVMRVHRHSLDRLLSATFLPDARRYRCTNAACGWSGLRHHEPHVHHSSRPQFPQPPG
jgi:uncharacterized paraquat-inducible protein A